MGFLGALVLALAAAQLCVALVVALGALVARAVR